MFFVGPQLVRVLRRSKPAMGLFFGVLEGVRTSEGRFPKEPAMYHVYHGHHGHHHQQQLFVLWQCWCQGKVSCNSSERLQLVTSYHLLQLQTALELNKYKNKSISLLYQ